MIHTVKQVRGPVTAYCDRRKERDPVYFGEILLVHNYKVIKDEADACFVTCERYGIEKFREFHRMPGRGLSQGAGHESNLI